MTKLILLTILILIVAPVQAQETYRLPPNLMPITYLTQLAVGDTSRQMSESERRDLVRLLVKSYVVSVRKYNQGYPLPIDVPVYKLLKTNFPDVAKHEGEGMVMLSDITTFVYRIPEYKPIVDQVLREDLPKKGKRCSK